MELDESSANHQARNGSIGPLSTVASFLKVETDVGSGGGVLNLVFDETDKEWKAFTLFTFLRELKGYGEKIGERRVYGYEAEKEGVSWGEKRVAEDRLEDAEPVVLIVGKSALH